MRRISTFGAAIAGLALALAPAAFGQTNSQPTGPQDPRKETSPSAAQNNPDRGAYDPARVGTSTRSNDDMNNNRNPTQAQTNQETVTTTSPSTTYETSTPSNTTYTTTAAPTNPAPKALPKTASSLPLAGLAGLSALGAALALRSRRLFR